MGINEKINYNTLNNINKSETPIEDYKSEIPLNYYIKEKNQTNLDGGIKTFGQYIDKRSDTISENFNSNNVKLVDQKSFLNLCKYLASTENFGILIDIIGSTLTEEQKIIVINEIDKRMSEKHSNTNKSK